jgi:FkbM family methyltransferase
MDDFIWLYQRLNDCASRTILTNVLYYWITFDNQYLTNSCESRYQQYFDHDIIKINQNDVFVDIGAYNGDTLLTFLDNYKEYKKIICYELDPNNYKELAETSKNFPNIETRNNAVGLNHGEKVAVNIQEERSVSSRISKKQEDTAQKLIEMVSLDEDIKEKITFLKMDVEGAERDILRGASRHIKEEHPKLAVCIYHRNEDLWKIARIIDVLDDSYQLYIRYYGGTLYPNEIVLYAI